MSNKKRIAKRISSLKQKQYPDLNKWDGLAGIVKELQTRRHHMADAFKYFAAGMEIWKKELPNEFEYGIDFGSLRMIQKSIFEKVPAKYVNDFVNLVDVGFSEEDAFETLQETYKF